MSLHFFVELPRKYIFIDLPDVSRHLLISNLITRFWIALLWERTALLSKG